MKLDYVNYMLIILFGVGMAVAVFMKLVLGFNIDSDWFWFIAGLGIAIEGFISFEKQRMFDRKYKVVRRA
jgi:hypothetical protein